MDFRLTQPIRLIGAMLITLYSLSSMAAVPDGISYQAYLADSDGAPINTDISITFAAYTVDVGGVPLWSDTMTISPDNGLFSVVLGNPANPFPANLFDTPVFIGLFVAGEEMLPRRALQAVPYSFKSEDANTLTGFTSADLDQSTEVADLESSVTAIDGSVTTLQSDVSAISVEVGNNANGIANNAADISVNDGRISSLEAVGGDITNVVAGAGLTGGAASGSAVLALATGGVASTNLSDDSVTRPKISDNAVGADQLDEAGNYTINGLVTNGPTDIEGAFTINSTSDVKIRDNFNGFRWFSTDGSTQYASIEVRELDTTFRDQVRGRTIIRSNATGLSLGTNALVATHDVTMPSVAFTGNIDIGLERVLTQYTLSSMSGSCHSHGNLPCYYGLTTVTCPVGKRLLGGGTSGSSGLFGSISIAQPGSDTSFTCGASYDIANSTRTCYALCANID